MPHYFFHIHDGDDLVDDEGVELADAAQARHEAVIVAGSMLRDGIPLTWDARPWVLHVVDQRGLTVCRLTLSGTLR